MGKLEELHRLVGVRNGTCQAVEWLGRKHSYPVRCSSGHEWNISYDSLARGSWCRKCIPRQSEEERKNSRREAALRYARTAEAKEKARQRYLDVKDTVEFKEKSANTQLLRRFGITLKQFEELMNGQRGLCALCGDRLERGYYCVVDHDHTTGKICGLLHRKCNSAIGFLDDSADKAQKAWKYLEVSRGKNA